MSFELNEVREYADIPSDHHKVLFWHRICWILHIYICLNLHLNIWIRNCTQYIHMKTWDSNFVNIIIEKPILFIYIIPRFWGIKTDFKFNLKHLQLDKDKGWILNIPVLTAGQRRQQRQLPCELLRIQRRRGCSIRSFDLNIKFVFTTNIYLRKINV